MPRIGLVLGAGGIVGHAFHAGVLAALHEATGWDPRDAEVIVGTSAGSGVGAALRAGMSAADLAARASGEPLSDAGDRIVARLGPPVAVSERVARTSALPQMAAPRLVLRKALRPWKLRVGSAIAGALPEGRLPTEPMAVGLRRIFGGEWPERALWICAVRLTDGRRVVFGRDRVPGASVADAVAASCAIPGYFTPVEIGGVRFVDGGAHSPTNADVLAKLGLDLVIVSSPMSTASGVRRLAFDFPARVLCRVRLAEETAKVRLRGTRVVAFEPTAADQAVMGLDALDARKRRPVVSAARASTLRRLERAEFRDRLAAVLE